MPQKTRANMTFILWFLSAMTLVALFLSAGAQGELTNGHLLLAGVILTLDVVGTVFFFRGTDSEPQEAKAKRQRIDSLLSDMSDEELIELKQRLSEADYSQEAILDKLGDDGELIRRG